MATPDSESGKADLLSQDPTPHVSFAALKEPSGYRPIAAHSPQSGQPYHAEADNS